MALTADSPMDDVRQVWHRVIRKDLEPDVRSDAAYEIVAWLDTNDYNGFILSYPDGAKTLRTRKEILIICEAAIREELFDL